ncbi:MAG TPA: hypothetical protein VJS38_07310 [Phenylobacterium sp.]|nr:hypothetical protein [Phenylobacterium sp.]HKT53198.1 hypothetical protein [Caulobacteraceae bacterium]
MQTFRAYLQDGDGAITWAAWIDAVHVAEAKLMAQDLCGAETPTVDLWSPTDRRLTAVCKLDPV